MPEYVRADILNLPRAAYDEVNVAEDTAFVAGNAVYGFIPSNFRTFLAGAGTATTNGVMFQTTSGSSLGDYGVIRSFRSLNYKTGQGASIKCSGYFGTPQALTWSGMGGFNIGDEFSFGYNGLDFGIWHRYGGQAETQCLTITSGATGSETATITINDVVYNVPLTSGSVQENAYEIEAYINANATDIEAEQVDDCVQILFLSDGAKSGAYSFSSATATGSFAQLNAGVTKTSRHIPVANWTAEPPTDFDPLKGNTYKIDYQNGFGEAHFFIEDKDSGRYKEVHVLRWANRNTVPNLTNPSLRVGCYATCIGSPTPVEVNMAYVAGFVEGQISKTRNPRAFSNTKSIDTTLTNVLTLRNTRVYNGYANQVEIAPINVTLANDGGKTAIFELRGNPTVAGPTNFQAPGNNLVSQYDITGDTVTENGRLLASFVVAKGSSITVDLTPFLIRQPPTLRLVIAGRMASGAASDLTASLVWYEDV